MPRPPQCKPAHKKENKKATCRCDRLPFFVVIYSYSSKRVNLYSKKEGADKPVAYDTS